MNINKIDSRTNFNGNIHVAGRTIMPSGNTVWADNIEIDTNQIIGISVNKNNAKVTDIKWCKNSKDYTTRAFTDINTVLNAYNATKINPSLNVNLVG